MAFISGMLYGMAVAILGLQLYAVVTQGHYEWAPNPESINQSAMDRG